MANIMNLTVKIDIEDKFYDDFERLKEEYQDICQRINEFNARNALVTIKKPEFEMHPDRMNDYFKMTF